MRNMLFSFCFALMLCGTSLVFATERTVDANFVAAPRTAYTNWKRETEAVKETPAAQGGWNLRDRKREGAVILRNGNFGEANDNWVFELQIGNLKRIKLRTCSGSESLAWATYDANGNVCRLGPQAKIATTGDIDPQSMDKFEIFFTPQEKLLCFSVGKAVRGRIKILYFTESDDDDTEK